MCGHRKIVLIQDRKNLIDKLSKVSTSPIPLIFMTKKHKIGVDSSKSENVGTGNHCSSSRLNLHKCKITVHDQHTTRNMTDPLKKGHFGNGPFVLYIQKLSLGRRPQFVMNLNVK